MIIHIDYMQNYRDILMVELILNLLNIRFTKVDIGTIYLEEKLSDEQYNLLVFKLREIKLEIVESTKAILVAKIKFCIIQQICQKGEHPKVVYSDFLHVLFNKEYTYLARVFLELTKITIHQFIKYQVIERIKILLIVEGLTLTEIAFQMNYNSVNYLSFLFKSVVNMTVSEYKLSMVSDE